ncbi:MAG: FAD-dependent oxidoreductase [Clostridiales Family XIII bacterium]|jgi:2,4-dienoyl-CoA reductase (NADPH2)|nr:FAD-dependent oxidoreductase [Clostridiales Family XIII bacterium]
MTYEHLFSPLIINKLKIKNRIVMQPMHLLYTPDGFCTERFREYYFKRAEGGTGLIITGGCKFDDFGGAFSMMSLESDDFIPGWKAFTDGMHERDAKVGVQLYHAGRYSHQKGLKPGLEAIAPSAVYSTFTRETPKEMTRDELKEIIEKWTEGAVRAKKAGFDLVEIVGSAGYLICQFLSPVTNLRTDEYGGSWENRTRFPLELVASLRAAVGPDYPLCMRISGSDFMPGSNTNKDAIEFAKLMDAAGIDLLNVTGGWHETKVPQLPGDVPRGGYTYLAANVKDVVNIPVLASNRITTPALAEKLLAIGRCDLIGISRPLLADPEWPVKALEGRADEIRGCVACNQGCLAKTFFAKPVECLVNGDAGREYLCRDVKPKPSKDILVVGSGPAGCEFAIRASGYGHRVTLREKENTIGGQIPVAAVPPGKHEFRDLIRYYETMLKRCDVKVELGKEVTEDCIGDFDAVVLATGVRYRSISLPANSSIPVYYASDVLSGNVVAGKNVVIVGGGSVGCETAQWLVHDASADGELLHFLMSVKAEPLDVLEAMIYHSDRTVNIVEIAKVGAGFDLGTGWPVLNDLKRMGVGTYGNSKLTEIRDRCVVFEQTDQEGNPKTVTVPCDTIIVAVGSESNNALYEKIKDQVANLHLIGDAHAVGKVIDAVREADLLAAEI